MAYSFIQSCILFLTWVNWICEHYEHCFIIRLLFLSSLPVSFLLHFASSHRLPLSLVSIISIRFTFISFCVMMTCSHPRATSKVCHTLRSAYRFLSGILRLRGPFGIGGLRFFWLDCVSMAFGLHWWSGAKKKQKKNKKKTKICVCLVFVNILRIIKGHLGLRDLLFL